MRMYKILSLLGFLFLAQLCAAQDIIAEWAQPAVVTDVDSITYNLKEQDTYLLTWKGGKQGVVDRKNNVILPAEYNRIKIYPGGWINANKKGVDYWFGEGGKPLLDTIEKAVFTQSNYLVVSRKGQWGAVDNKGKVKIPVEFERYVQVGNRFVFFKGTKETELTVTPAPQFPAVQREIDEKAKAPLPGYYMVSQNKKSGFLNAKGDTVVPMIYTFGAIHPDGYIAASLEPNHWGIIDKNHKTLRLFTADRFEQWTKSGLITVVENKKYGVLRFPENTEVLPFGKYEIIEVYDKNKDWFMVTLGGKKGIVDANDNIIMPAEYTYVQKNDTRIAILLKDRLRGYWIPSLGIKVEPAYSEIDVVNDTICVVRTDSTSAVIDIERGKELIPLEKGYFRKWKGYYVWAKNGEAFSNGRYRALYDLDGKLVFKSDSSAIHIFSDRSFLVESGTKPTKDTEHRSSKGELLRSWKAFSAFPSNDCFIRVNPDYRKNSFFIVSDPVGQEFIYDDVPWAVENVHIVKKDKMYGLVTKDGKILARPVLDAVLPSRGGFIRVKYQGKWGVLVNPAYKPK